MTLTRGRVLLIGTAIAVPLLVAAWFIPPMFKPQTASAVPIGGPFALVDNTGTPVTDEDFRGRLMMITFGYTFCPDVCPMSLQDMSLAMDELADDADDVALVFVSVDPARDTVEQLASYVELFHPNLVGLTGSEEDIAAAAKAYRVYYTRHDEEGGDDYLVDHSTFIYVMGPDGQYLQHFGYGTSPQDMATELEQYL